MRNPDSEPIRRRLHTVTVALREAFARAAGAVGSPGLAALLAQRASEQARIASYLSAQLAVPSRTFTTESATPIGGKHDDSPGAVNEPTGFAREASIRDADALLVECIRLLDASMLEFRGAHGCAMSLTERILLDRHRDQMGWAREELVHLRGEQQSLRLLRRDEDPAVHLHLLYPSRAMPRLSNRQDGWRSNATPREQGVKLTLRAER
ncbi:MAG: hypothetical protein Q8K82_14675 [Gemmatimonadaceae bacterium]|nr:hypothetical protein [Gemmatimonadaceae bacterium]